MKQFIFLLFLGCSFFACSDDGDEMQPETATANESITKNGQAVSITDTNHSLKYDDFDVAIGRTLFLRFEIDGGLLLLGASNWDWQNPPTDAVIEKAYSTTVGGTGTQCEIISGAQYCDGGVASYQIGESTVYIGSPEFDEAFINITDNNGEDKTASGSFAVKLMNFDDASDILDFGGTFSNASYVIE